jgi:hypothetical protein
MTPKEKNDLKIKFEIEREAKCKELKTLSMTI